MTIDRALLDVRKAYRLIHSYQEMALDLCETIVEHLKRELKCTLRFYHWSPSWADSPPKANSDPTARKSIWDFTPLYDFCVLYLPETADYENHKPGDWMLVIRVLADSGYDTAAGPGDPRDFADPASCDALLRSYVYFCDKAFTANWCWDVYHASDFPPPSGEVSPLRSESRARSEIRALGMQYPLVQLSDPEGVRDRVDDYIGRLRKAFPTIGSGPSGK